MRSLESDKRKAIKNLEHDITNCINHIYGDHSRCSDFCKANLKDKSSVQAIDDNDDTENIFDEQCCFWNEGTSNDVLEESRLSSDLSITDLMSCMRQDLSLILSRVAKKSSSLLGNFTSNLAEMWMHVRTKYDGVRSIIIVIVDLGITDAMLQVCALIKVFSGHHKPGKKQLHRSLDITLLICIVRDYNA
ncbi:unnamed protein product [Mytilus coruscus]|uniref:Uncharacterized protein n=1 Tax=Mytilus coruscus TaxID=42192 RepID=A0A6J8DDU8_MYTCO|nr:unnamed protein product [Mytilus coruscus]